jgi:hypothetical protein
MWTRVSIALALLVGAGCKDPGCIRNSECPKHFTCVKSVCKPDATDAGRATPDAAVMSSPPSDASVIIDL